jgi:hypothetical protein
VQQAALSDGSSLDALTALQDGLIAAEEGTLAMGVEDFWLIFTPWQL